MILRAIVAWLSLLAFAPSVEGQAPAPTEAPVGEGFTSDRPGFASTTAVAAVARLTAELGVAATLDDPQTLALPNTSLRVGVLSWAELRLRGMNAVLSFDDTAGTRFGLGDVSVGMKLGGSLVPGVMVATVIEVSLPTASDGFGAPEAVPTAELLADFVATPWLTVTVNGTAAVMAAIDATTMQTVRFAAGGASLKLLFTPLDGLSVYAQTFVLGDERSSVSVAVGGGVSYMFLPNLQVDLSFDSRVTDDGPPPTLGAGTTVLF